MGRLRELHERFKDRAEFLLIHIRDAHPDRREPGDLGAFARAEVKRLDVPFACVLDGEQKGAEAAYKAWPLRLVVVSPDGRIAYDAGIGVFDAWDLNAVASWLEAHAGRPGRAALREAAVEPHAAEAD